MTHCAESKENVKQPRREFFSLLEFDDCELHRALHLRHKKYIAALQYVVVLDALSPLVVLYRLWFAALDIVGGNVLNVVATPRWETGLTL